MSTDFSPELNRLIEHELALGRYGNEEELLTEAVQLLSQRNALREHIELGTRQLATGDYTEYDSNSLRDRLNDLKSGKSFRAERDT